MSLICLTRQVAVTFVRAGMNRAYSSRVASAARVVQDTLGFDGFRGMLVSEVGGQRVGGLAQMVQ